MPSEYTYLKDYTDEGFNALRRSLDQFRTEYYQHVGPHHAQLGVEQAGVINQFHIEVDRRFIEADAQVKTALISAEKALAVKQEADEKALELARGIQTYKDETHNGLINQLSAERSSYITQQQQQVLTEKIDVAIQSITDKLDSAIKPLQDFMISQIASGAGVKDFESKGDARVSRRLVIMGVTISAVVVAINVMFFVLSHGAFK